MLAIFNPYRCTRGSCVFLYECFDMQIYGLKKSTQAVRLSWIFCSRCGFYITHYICHQKEASDQKGCQKGNFYNISGFVNTSMEHLFHSETVAYCAFKASVLKSTWNSLKLHLNLVCTNKNMTEFTAKSPAYNCDSGGGDLHL